MKTVKKLIIITGIAFLAVSTGSFAKGGKEAYFVKVDSETTTQNRASGKRQHKPFTVSKALDKSTPKLNEKIMKRTSKNRKAKARKIPGLHKTGDVTLKRGVIK